MIEGLVGVVVDLKVSASLVQGWWAVPCTSRSPSSVRAGPASSFGIVEAAAVAGRGWEGRLLGLEGLLEELLGGVLEELLEGLLEELREELLGGRGSREELLRTTFCCCVRLASTWHNISQLFTSSHVAQLELESRNSSTPSLDSQPGWSTDDL